MRLLEFYLQYPLYSQQTERKRMAASKPHQAVKKKNSTWMRKKSLQCLQLKMVPASVDVEMFNEGRFAERPTKLISQDTTINWCT